MISLEQLQAHFDEAGVNICQYRCRVNLNIYDSPSCTDLATQAATGRYLQIESVKPLEEALLVRLCEDGYCGWLSVQDISRLERATTIYQPVILKHEQIRERLPAVIAFTQQAMQQPNHYLWGGTVAPNYDCSGLMQSAFAASGIWLPRDSYQQADFTHKIGIEQLLAGDLVFFAKAEKVNHVGLYLGDGYYIHSSGQETGRNGIAIDQLSADGDEIAQSYYRQFKVAGRVVESYQPQK
ncbi:MAG: C40 family peptidase [Coleofasciculaceae cyanobacterium]